MNARKRFLRVLAAVDAVSPRPSFPFGNAARSPLAIACGVSPPVGPAARATVATAVLHRWGEPAVWTFGALDAFDGLPACVPDVFDVAGQAEDYDPAKEARHYARGHAFGRALRRVLLELPGLAWRPEEPAARAVAA